jgi:hypothetical protein
VTAFHDEPYAGSASTNLDPAAVDLDAFAADPGTLVVAEAGEVLFRRR